MICEWLARGALCSQAYEQYRDHEEFFRRIGLPRAEGRRHCHGPELAAAVVVDELLVPFFYGRGAGPSRAVVQALWELSAAATPAVVAANALAPDGAVVAVQGPCIFGLELSRPAILAGPPQLLEPLREYLSSPIFEPFSEYVAAVEAGYGELEEVGRRYGAAAYVSCIADAPPPAYIILCAAHREFGDMLAEALGAKPARAEPRVHVADAEIIIKQFPLARGPSP